MNNLYVTKAEGIYDRLDEILIKLTGGSPKILRTENGKPYVDGNPLFFSLSHSGKHGMIAVCDRPVGVDLEIYKNKNRYALTARFPFDEQLEILTEKDFLIHWTVREAFVKMRGSTLANDLKSMAYYEGNLYFDGEKQNVEIQTHVFDYGVVTVCIEK